MYYPKKDAVMLCFYLQERLYLSQLSQLENISAAPRSDPVYLRNQYEIDSLTKKVAEQKCQMNQQEKDLEIKMNENAKKLKDTENEMLVIFCF